MSRSSKSAGRPSGPGRTNPNYNKALFFKIVKDILPASTKGWDAVAALYKEESEEANLRDPANIKAYFIKKLCNSNKKPTGQSSASKGITRAQDVYRLILQKESAGNYGGSDLDSDDDDNDSYGEADGDYAENEEEEEQEHNLPEEGEYESDNEQLGNGVAPAIALPAPPAPLVERAPVHAHAPGGTGGAQRRRHHQDDEVMQPKTKNSRPNPRKGGVGALNTLAEGIKESSQMGIMMQMMQQQSQQQQQAQQQQMQMMQMQQSQSQQQQLMLMLFQQNNGNPAPAAGNQIIHPSPQSQGNYDQNSSLMTSSSSSSSGLDLSPMEPHVYQTRSGHQQGGTSDNVLL